MAGTHIECDNELLHGLEHASAAEIDVLVDVVTDFARGRAGLDADAKKFLIHAKHASRFDGYTQEQLRLLGHELQQFGGHSAMNLARRLLGKSAVAYAEIVDDVYRKLNARSTTGKTVADKEREIALALFGENWKQLAIPERYERSTSVKVLSGFFSFKDALSVNSAGRLTGISASASAALFSAATVGFRLNPAGLAASAGISMNSAVAEAYRVTVPFVAQMGWIRLRRETATTEPSLPQEQPLAAAVTAAPDLELHDENGSSLMKLSIIERVQVETGRPMPQDLLGALNPLLSNVPGLAALAELHQGNYVLCSLPFDAMTPSANGDGGVRAFLKPGKHITENATLYMPDGLQNVLVSGAVWNAISSAVGQKHLHDINEKLTAIKKQLDAVQRDLHEQRWERLGGLVEYVQSLLDHYSQDGISSEALTALELREAELGELARFFERQIKDELQRAGEVDADKVFGVDASRNALEQGLGNLHGWVSGYLQVAQLKVVGCALRHLAQPRERYRSAAGRALDSLQPLSAWAIESRKTYGAQMELTSSRVFSIEESKRDSFALQLDALTDLMTSGQGDTRELHRTLFGQGDRQVLLKYDNGRFTQGRLLEPVA